MGRAPCCSKVGLHRGSWTVREDLLLTEYIHSHGEGNWRSLPKKAGLLRCGKSCRLRWMNYLRPDIKRGNISREEEELITRLHRLLGNRWSLIAGRLPGRTDNEIKNYWNSHLSKKLKSQGLLNKQQTFVLKKKRETSKKSAENAQTARIYAPKPTRFLPAMMSWSSAAGGGDDSSGFTGSASLAPSWQSRDDSSSDKEFDRAGAGFLDLDCDFGEEAGEETLEKLYREYSQLLELEVDVKPIIH